MRKNQIIDESFKLFAKQGYETTTMQQIGNAVGLDKSSLYVHFKNKSEIFLNVLTAEGDGLIQSVVDHTDSSSGCCKDLLRSMFVNMLIYFSNRDKLLFWKQIMLYNNSGVTQEVTEQINEVFRMLNTSILNKLNDTLLDIADPVKYKKIIACIYILIQGFLDWQMVQPRFDEQTMMTAIEMFDDFLDSNPLFS